MALDFQVFTSKVLPGINAKSVHSVIELHKEGATVPFIARYRKERTGNLDEVQVRDVIQAHETFEELIKRQAFILKEVEAQGNLTAELKDRIIKTIDLGELEEIYRPFKKKKKTKATEAREAGIEPFANWIWDVGHGVTSDTTTLEVKAKDYLNPAAKFATYDAVLKGAQDILIERLTNDVAIREKALQDVLEDGRITSKKTKNFKPHSKYEMYAEFEEPIKRLIEQKASHRYLAMRRGWQEEELALSVEPGHPDVIEKLFQDAARTDKTSVASEFLERTAGLAWTGSVFPSITNEVHRRLKDAADEHAILVFAENVRKLLLASPFGSKCVLGVDPGLRTGCKVALVDKGGNFLTHTVIHIVGASAEGKLESIFSELLTKIPIDAIAVGNGTGGRETEAAIRAVIKKLGKTVPVVLVNESGASVYSASDVAREEFPELDLTVRGAISIARRLQDPLAELVKIDPKSIGVGQYQHDVSQTRLKKSLDFVVESCVNSVGIDLNTASSYLLGYVSGIGPAVAKNIVEHRKTAGLFTDRDSLLKVPRFSAKVFEQAAGFLRVQNSQSVLDQTGIHPERYSAVKEMSSELGVPVSQLIGEGAKKLLPLRTKYSALIGEFTFDDIVKELEKPGRDPRDAFKVFSFRDDIFEVKDLTENMICPGLVTNVTNFGAFVDIGVHQDGLVHISELADKFVDDPRKVVNTGDAVQVRVLKVDKDKNQISLSMRMSDTAERKMMRDESAEARAPRAPRAPGAGRAAGSGARVPGGAEGAPRGGARAPRAGGAARGAAGAGAGAKAAAFTQPADPNASRPSPAAPGSRPSFGDRQARSGGDRDRGPRGGHDRDRRDREPNIPKGQTDSNRGSSITSSNFKSSPFNNSFSNLVGLKDQLKK